MGRLTDPARALRAALLALALAGSCAKARPAVTGTRRCVTWKEEVGPLLADRCTGCHGGAKPAAGYDTASYLGTLGNGSDGVPNAVAGDESSLLLQTLAPAAANQTHQTAIGTSFPTVQSWVVDCALSYDTSSVHAAGILNPASPDFHGELVRANKYDFSLCAECHGQDFTGGTSQVSCTSCHQDGPTACSTCHGDIASKGAHARHLGGGPLGKMYGCPECHKTPTTYTDPGHIFLADGSLDPPPAEVTLGAMAALTPAGATRAAAPSYDAGTSTCSNIYCHGAVLGDSAATNTNPSWKGAGQGQADCGTCHGLPPNNVNNNACAMCHPSVVDRDRTIIAADLHVNGKVDLGPADKGCAGCHGSMTTPAPPPDLSGQTAPTAPGVGAHQAHVQGKAHLGAPIACTECHRTPKEVGDPGHIGGHGPGADVYPAEVFPTDPTVGALAAADGAQPSFDGATGTCAGVYCHGGGAKLAGDTTANLDRAPVWTDATGLTCGAACHGAPPALAPHQPTMTRLDCAVCHRRTVDPFGNIIIAGAPGAETSFHMNGAIDVSM